MEGVMKATGKLLVIDGNTEDKTPILVTIELADGMKVIGKCKTCKFYEEDSLTFEDTCKNKNVMLNAPDYISSSGCGYWKAKK